jgi:hypothetical protein
MEMAAQKVLQHVKGLNAKSEPEIMRHLPM